MAAGVRAPLGLGKMVARLIPAVVAAAVAGAGPMQAHPRQVRTALAQMAGLAVTAQAVLGQGPEETQGAVREL